MYIKLFFTFIYLSFFNNPNFCTSDMKYIKQMEVPEGWISNNNIFLLSMPPVFFLKKVENSDNKLENFYFESVDNGVETSVKDFIDNNKIQHYHIFMVVREIEKGNPTTKYILIRTDKDTYDEDGMSSLFENCKDIIQISYILGNPKEQVKNFSSMCKGCINLQKVDFKNMIHGNQSDDNNLSINMKKMFDECTNLKEVSFNQCEIICNAVELNEMFYRCKNLEKINFGTFYINNYSNKKIDFYKIFCEKDFVNDGYCYLDLEYDGQECHYKPFSLPKDIEITVKKHNNNNDNSKCIEDMIQSIYDIKEKNIFNCIFPCCCDSLDSFTKKNCKIS